MYTVEESGLEYVVINPDGDVVSIHSVYLLAQAECNMLNYNVEKGYL